VIGSSFWNSGIGRESGAVEGETEAIQTKETFGKNMAWLLKKLHE
jgi:hypothetical protein